MKYFLPEQYIHRVFKWSLMLKAAFASIEIAGGILAMVVNSDQVLRVVLALTQEELSEDPKDLIATSLVHAAEHFSVSAQHFIALYLLAHGIIKVFLVVRLMKDKVLYYPLSIAVFTIFICYQLYRFTGTHSLWLLVLTAFDMLIVWLVFHEYRLLKHRRSPSRGT